jgi:hypothetical protein
VNEFEAPFRVIRPIDWLAQLVYHPWPRPAAMLVGVLTVLANVVTTRQ